MEWNDRTIKIHSCYEQLIAIVFLPILKNVFVNLTSDKVIGYTEVAEFDSKSFARILRHTCYDRLVTHINHFRINFTSAQERSGTLLINETWTVHLWIHLKAISDVSPYFHEFFDKVRICFFRFHWVSVLWYCRSWKRL